MENLLVENNVLTQDMVEDVELLNQLGYRIKKTIYDHNTSLRDLYDDFLNRNRLGGYVSKRGQTTIGHLTAVIVDDERLGVVIYYVDSDTFSKVPAVPDMDKKSPLTIMKEIHETYERAFYERLEPWTRVS